MILAVCTTGLGSLARAGEIHQDMPQQLSGDAEEMGAVLPPHSLPINQPHISFVDQRRGLQGMACALAAHVPFSQPVQFRIDQRGQIFQGCFVSIAPGQEQLCDFIGRRRRHRSSFRCRD